MSYWYVGRCHCHGCINKTGGYTIVISSKKGVQRWPALRTDAEFVAEYDSAIKAVELALLLSKIERKHITKSLRDEEFDSLRAEVGFDPTMID